MSIKGQANSKNRLESKIRSNTNLETFTVIDAAEITSFRLYRVLLLLYCI